MKKPNKKAAKMRDMKPRKDPKAGGGFGGNKSPQGGGSATQGGGDSIDPNKHPIQ